MIKTEKISSWTLWGCMAVIAVVFILFFAVGFDNAEYTESGTYTAPLFTEALMWLMYIMTAVAAVLCVWAGYRGIMASRGGKKGENLSGVPGGIVSTCAVGALVVSLIIGVLLGIGEKAYVAMDGTTTSAGWVQIVDMFIFSIYILSALTAIGVIVNMLGVFKKNKFQ